MIKKIIAILSIATYLVLNITPACAETIESSLSFDDDNAGSEFFDISGYWQIIKGTGESTAIVKEEGDDNKYIAVNGYVDIRTYDYIIEPYTFSVDVQLVDSVNICFFVRGVFPYKKFNKAHRDGVYMTMNYYESDWYTDNGGKDGQNGQGGSGIAVAPGSDAIRVIIKTCEKDGMNIGSKYYDFPYPEGVNKNEFFNLKFTDNGEKVEIYINDGLLAKVSMSDPGEYDDEMTADEEYNVYFRTAVVHDANDNELLKVENSRINSEGSQIALGVRNRKVNIDNITLVYELPDPTPTPEPSNTPEMTSAPPTATTSDHSSEDSSSTGAAIAIGVGVTLAVIAAITVVTIILIKSKKR